jgi:hypothetical protein
MLSMGVAAHLGPEIALGEMVSGDPGTLVRAAFDNSYAAGVLHIAAAGNSGSNHGKNDSVGYPAKTIHQFLRRAL